MKKHIGTILKREGRKGEYATHLRKDGKKFANRITRRIKVKDDDRLSKAD